jgi:hypothetical protein
LELRPGKETDPFYHSRKANILRLKNQLSELEKFINKAIKLDKKAYYYGILSQIKLDQAMEAIRNEDRDMAFAFLYAAEVAVNTGLGIERENQTLLSILHSVKDLKIRFGIQ